MHRPFRVILRPLVLSSLFVVGMLSPAARAEYTFTPLYSTLPNFPTLPGVSFPNYGFALSGNGNVVVGETIDYTGNDLFACRWDIGEHDEDLGGEVLSGIASPSYAFGTSANGSVIVGRAPTSNHAYRWTTVDGPVSLGGLDGDANYDSGAYGISADGSVVVGFGATSSGQEAFRWTSADGMVSLGDFQGGINNSAANGISADGSVIVGFGTTEFGKEAFRWTATDGMIGLGDLPGGDYYSVAKDASADGSVIVGLSSSDQGLEVFRWTSAEGMISLGKLGDYTYDIFEGRSVGVSADGSVVVGGVSHGDGAFLWTSSLGRVNLRNYLIAHGVTIPAGWQLSAGFDVSDDGRTILGTGINDRDGLLSQPEWPQAFIVTIPETSTLLLTGIWAIALVTLACRKRQAI